MTLTDWFAQYLDLYKRGCKPRTLEEYRRLYAAHVAPVIGSQDVLKVTPEDIQRALIGALDRSGARTAQAVHALLRALYRRAVRSRMVTWSPVDAVDRPQHTATPGVAMTDEDYAAALPWISDDLGLSLALMAGLRRGEIAGLQWGDVDLSRRLLSISRTRQRVSGARSRAEHIGLPRNHGSAHAHQKPMTGAGNACSGSSSTCPSTTASTICAIHTSHGY